MKRILLLLVFALLAGCHEDSPCDDMTRFCAASCRAIPTPSERPACYEQCAHVYRSCWGN